MGSVKWVNRRDALPKSRFGRRWLKRSIDFSLVAGAVVAAYLIRFEELPPKPYLWQVPWIILVLGALRGIVWAWSGVYAQSWRLFGLREAVTLSGGSVAVTGLFLVARLVAPELGVWSRPPPVGVIALEGLFVLTGTLVVRVFTRLWDEQASRTAEASAGGPPVRRALLAGAGRGGRLAARELRNRPDAGYVVVGFLDDDPTRLGLFIEGAPVLGTTAQAAEVARACEAEVIILTMPSVPPAVLREVVTRCQQAALPVRTVPGFYELVGGKVSISKIRPLRIEDLLGRKVVPEDERLRQRVDEAFTGKCILVTGAGGSIGSELCRQLAKLGPAKLLLVENNENNLFDIDNEIRERIGARAVACLADVRDRAGLARLFAQHRPEVVFHAAAFKHVPMMELHPGAAVENNVLGTQAIVQVAHDHGVERFLMISTDKAVNPTNVMGASKRAAELVVQAQAAQSETRFCCVRFGNVLGSRGSVLHTFRRQIENGGPVTVTHPEVTRFFMTIPEAVRLVIQAAAVGEGGEVFLLDMGEPVRILDLAKQMIELAGLTCDEVPIRLVGLRPGEKLHEELLREEEGREASAVEGIFVAKLARVDPTDLAPWLEKLRDAAKADDTARVQRLLAQRTGYRPPNRVSGPLPLPPRPTGEPTVRAAG